MENPNYSGPGSTLADFEIEALREDGLVVIEPFNPLQLSNMSYDLTLGPHVWRYKKPDWKSVLNPSRHDPSQWFTHQDNTEEGEIIFAPGERLLGHSIEFAGGRAKDGTGILSYLAATSTAARVGFTVCMCAGQGDVPFFNRWTFEIENRSPYALVLPVGSIIAQIIFEPTSAPRKNYLAQGGNYQKSEDVKEVMEHWVPEMMLPKRIKTSSSLEAKNIQTKMKKDKEPLYMTHKRWRNAEGEALTVTGFNPAREEIHYVWERTSQPGIRAPDRFLEDFVPVLN